MPSRAYTSFLQKLEKISTMRQTSVSMPSRAYTSFLRCNVCIRRSPLFILCQCPLGLIPHFYSPSVVMVQGEMTLCQCPLGLIPHFYGVYFHQYGTPDQVSMPSRAYTSFLRYPFKNLGFMRFPEPVFAGIYQNILTTAVFCAC